MLQTYRLELQYPSDPSQEVEDRITSIVPLVINTQGWVKGLGADLLGKIHEAAEPTHLFTFDAPTWNGEDSATPKIVAQPKDVSSHNLTAIPATTSKLTPADLRIIATMSYLHAKFTPGKPMGVGWSTTLPLCKQEPWEITTNVVLDAVVLTGPGGEDVVADELVRALNCGLVGLVAVEPGEYDTTHPTGTIPYSQGAAPPSPFTSECVGLGFIRAVSHDLHTMHLLSPIPIDMLTRARIMVKGEMEIPIWAMFDYTDVDAEKGLCGVDWAQVPYLQWGASTGAGASKRRIRRNVMRRGQA